MGNLFALPLHHPMRLSTLPRTRSFRSRSPKQWNRHRLLLQMLQPSQAVDQEKLQTNQHNRLNKTGTVLKYVFNRFQ